jgi:hypothetical protein
MITYLRSLFLHQAKAKNIIFLVRVGRLQQACKLLNKICSPLRIHIEWGDDLVFTKMQWHANAPTKATFVISKHTPKERLDFFINRFIFTLPLIRLYHQSQYFIPGTIALNLDDSADAPGLAFCSNRIDSILIPDAEFIQTYGYQATRQAIKANPIAWEKRLPIVFWRGSSTGVRSTNHWQSIPRIELCQQIQLLSQEEQAFFDVGVTALTQMQDWEKHEFLTNMQLKPFVPMLDSAMYCYQIDIDGNTNAWGALFQKLLMGCLVFKIQSPHQFMQWYYSRLEPYTHYIPIKADLSDLLEKVNWARSNSDEARKIAANGQSLAFSMTYEEELDQSAQIMANNMTG